jgi:endonuclease-3
MDKKTYNNEILEVLNLLYPEAKAELDYTTPYELLIATILSAQCTDIRVNIITKELFKVGNTPENMVELGIEKVIPLIASCGMYKMKSKYLIEASMIICEKFGGEVPETIEQLMELPGVGRKTANVVASNAFGIPAIAVDTHVFRVANRLKLADAKTVDETELQLMASTPRARWTLLHHQLIYHGRRVCKARKPLCSECDLRPLCPHYSIIEGE